MQFGLSLPVNGERSEEVSSPIRSKGSSFKKKQQTYAFVSQGVDELRLGPAHLCTLLEHLDGLVHLVLLQQELGESSDGDVALLVCGSRGESALLAEAQM